MLNVLLPSQAGSLVCLDLKGWGRVIFLSSESGVADVEEVANLVAYIASPLSSATTGAALRVDGGVVDSLAI